VTAGSTVTTGVDAEPVGAPAREARARVSRRRLVVAVVVLAAAFAGLLVKGLGGSLDYFDTVDQAVAQKAALGTRTLRLEGLVEPGTIHQNGSTVSFVAAGTHHRVLVVNHGDPPQLFQPNVPVVVVGHFAGSQFVSDQILVAHTAQYREEHPGRVKAPNGSSR
jgi:cytochrome c-type biogenesis protein CcmE